jgi:hypothetical protein
MFMVKGDTITVMGQVEAMNGFGGYGKVGYFCTKQLGDSEFQDRRIKVLDSH